MAAILPFLEEEHEIEAAQEPDFQVSGAPAHQGTWGTADAYGVDCGGKKYVASCDRHGTFVCVTSKAKAEESAADTRAFCDACRGSALDGLPAGVKVRKGPDHDFNGAWHLTYAGVVCSFGFSPELPRGWNMNRPHPWTGPKSKPGGFGEDLLGKLNGYGLVNNKAEAIQAIKDRIDAHDPWIQPYLRPAGTALDGLKGEKAKALAKLKRLLDRAEAHPEEEIDGVPIHAYFQNELDLYREEYREEPHFHGLDAEEFTGEVNHEIQIVEGDRLPKDDEEGLEDLQGFGDGDDEGEDDDVVVAKGTSQAEILQQQVEVNHVNLTRFVWNRSLVEEHLRSARYWIETIGPKKAKNEFVFKIDPPMPKDVRPWKLIGSHDGVTFRFFGDGNAKMACPTWDLPSGPPVTGGTCPGAAAAQTVVPPGQREQHLTKDKKSLKVLAPGGERIPFREAYTICSACYAGEGNFDYGEIQGATLLRYWWTKEMLRTPEGTQEWIEIMTSAILAMDIAPAADCYTDSVIRPIRIHSSGDFFSPAYARAWMHVANGVGDVDPTIMFWCPTRTWAAPTSKHDGSAFDWPEILSILTRPNLVVRASAYHVGDAAPEGLTEPGLPGYARGTTALVGPVDGKPKVFQAAFPDAIWTGEHDDRREYDCPVYALKKAGAKGSCAAAGCRVCWTRPDLRVNYALH